MIQIPQMISEVVQGLALGPIVGVILEVAKPRTIFFPIDKLDGLHCRNLLSEINALTHLPSLPPVRTMFAVWSLLLTPLAD
jgi:hypothetical protein